MTVGPLRTVVVVYMRVLRFADTVIVAAHAASAKPLREQDSVNIKMPLVNRVVVVAVYVAGPSVTVNLWMLQVN